MDICWWHLMTFDAHASFFCALEVVMFWHLQVQRRDLPKLFRPTPGRTQGNRGKVGSSGRSRLQLPGFGTNAWSNQQESKGHALKKTRKRLAGDRCLFFFSAGCFPSLYGVIIIRRMYIYICIYRHILCIYIYRHILCIYIYTHRYVCINICIYIYVYVYGSNYVHHFCVKIASCSGQLLLGWESSETAESVAWLDH